ncbi:hypothetical protein O988_08570 [Pseudogymnoascus sp. VKM F-3808]|nr:hypothetical protein O988_08570 [Pseudogymnoascus sp. VKM F-3808]
MGKYYDRKHLDREFEIGDQVWLRTEDYETTRLSKKLDHQQAGPFTIIDRPTEQTYTLNIDKNARIHNVLHVSKLEPCTPPVEGQADTQEELHLQLDIEWHMPLKQLTMTHLSQYPPKLVTQTLAKYTTPAKPIKPLPLKPNSSIFDIENYLYQIHCNYGRDKDSWHLIQKLVAFKDGTQRLNWREYEDMTECLTYSDFTNASMSPTKKKTKNPAKIRIGMFGTFQSTWVGKKLAHWQKEDLHIWGVAIRPALGYNSGKDLFIWDSNTENYATQNSQREDIDEKLYKNDLLGMQLRFIEHLEGPKKMRLHNVYMVGSGNEDGICLQLTANWIESVISSPLTLLPTTTSEFEEQGWRSVNWRTSAPHPPTPEEEESDLSTAEELEDPFTNDTAHDPDFEGIASGALDLLNRKGVQTRSQVVSRDQSEDSWS